MSDKIQNLAAYDPFADTGENEDLKVAGYIRKMSFFLKYNLSIKI